MRPASMPSGSRTAAGVSAIGRRGASRQRFQYGVNTENASPPPLGASSPGANAVTPGRSQLEVEPRESVRAPARVRAHVLREVDAVGAGLLCAALDLARDLSAPDDESPPSPRNRPVEVVQRVEEEGDAVRRAEAFEHRVVEDEQRHDVLALRAGRVERGVVVHAQVAREEDDSGRHQFAR